MPKKDVVKLNLKTNFSQSFDYSLFINDSTRLSVGIIEKHDLTEFLKTNSTINFYNVLKGKVDITHQQTSNIETFQVGESFIITQFNDLQWAVYNDTQLIYLTYELDTLNQIDELESNKIIPIVGFALCLIATVILINQQYTSNTIGVIISLVIIGFCFLMEWIYKKTEKK